MNRPSTMPSCCPAIWFALLAATLQPAVAGPREPTPLRDVRVLVSDGSARLRVECETAIVVQNDEGGRLGELSPSAAAEIFLSGDGSLAMDRRLGAGKAIRLKGEGGEPIALSVRRRGDWDQLGVYAGALRIVTTEGEALEVTNHVDLEDYIAGVVAAEAWPTFHEQALFGQAIVARTFALYHLSRDPLAAVDFSAAQGAQVYHGVRDDSVGRRAERATDITRGVVLVYNDGTKDRLFCAYYSAACGGRSQPAAPFGAESDVPPLRGDVPCDYCAIAPRETYRWGPVRLSLATVARKLAARYEEARKLGSITSIAVAERTGADRPLTLRFVGSSGETFDLLAERARHALDPNKIKSTDFRLRIDGGEVVFDTGRGFGHGLGLCQWGMEGLAEQGKSAGEILRYYYPTARLVRVY